MTDISQHKKYLENQLTELRAIIGKIQQEMSRAAQREQQLIGGLQVLEAIEKGTPVPAQNGEGAPPAA